jgi:hypothetical protein
MPVYEKLICNDLELIKLRKRSFLIHQVFAFDTQYYNIPYLKN